jgi:hypothetical protein
LTPLVAVEAAGRKAKAAPKLVGMPACNAISCAVE